jgi:hypothetical protein
LRRFVTMDPTKFMNVNNGGTSPKNSGTEEIK